MITKSLKLPSMQRVKQKIKLFLLFLHESICRGAHLKHLIETLPMSPQNKYFHFEIRKLVLHFCSIQLNLLALLGYNRIDTVEIN